MPTCANSQVAEGSQCLPGSQFAEVIAGDMIQVELPSSYEFSTYRWCAGLWLYDHPGHEDESFEHLGPRLHEMDASCSQLHWWEGSRTEKDV